MLYAQSQRVVLFWRRWRLWRWGLVSRYRHQGWASKDIYPLVLPWDFSFLAGHHMKAHHHRLSLQGGSCSTRSSCYDGLYALKLWTTAKPFSCCFCWLLWLLRWEKSDIKDDCGLTKPSGKHFLPMIKSFIKINLYYSFLSFLITFTGWPESHLGKRYLIWLSYRC